jgi:hypothetical protein
MNIKTAQYYQGSYGSNQCINVVTQDDVYMSVPLDPANTDYIAILEWAKIDGNSIEDAD